MAKRRASGTFEVQLVPQTPSDAAEGGVGRLTLAKTFRGDLEGESRGEMLAMSTTVAGSAGYVALERFRGTLGGRRGSFALQHNGTMDRGSPTLSVTVVPDSGSDELTGIAGTMGIVIDGGGHSYDFEYTLGD